MLKNNSTTEAGKTSKKEVAYPVFALEDCIRFSEAIKELGGSRTPVSKSVLARHFKVAESTPSFFQKLGASKCFGIIEGWGAYTLTEQGRHYFYPTNDSEKIEAGLAFLRKPAPFPILISRFDGEKLPNAATLGNILHQEAKITESWKDRLASVFVRSAQFLGILDQGGVLRFNAASKGDGYGAGGSPAVDNAGDEQPIADKATEIARFPRKSAPASPGHEVWVCPFQGRYVRLETPEEMPRELWEKLNAYVQSVLKPLEK